MNQLPENSLRIYDVTLYLIGLVVSIGVATYLKVGGHTYEGAVLPKVWQLIN